MALDDASRDLAAGSGGHEHEPARPALGSDDAATREAAGAVASAGHQVTGRCGLPRP
jgi:hypothetical protein